MNFSTGHKYPHSATPHLRYGLFYFLAGFHRNIAVGLLVVAMTFSSALSASAIPNISLTRVTIKLSPGLSNQVTRAFDGSIAFPTGASDLDAILLDRKCNGLIPYFTFDPISLQNPEFVRLGMNRYYKIEFAQTSESEIYRLVGRLSKCKGIELAEAIPLAMADLTPNDWGVSGRNMWFLDSVHARQAWDNQTGSSGILAITIDTGVDFNHEDLTANISTNSPEDLNHDGLFTAADVNGVDNDGNGFIDDVIGWDFVSHSYTEIAGASAAAGEEYGPRDNTPADVHGHGTHVCGSIAGVTNNAIGVPAVSFNVRTRCLRAGFAWLDGTTLYGSGYADDFAPAVQYATNLGARVISISFGGSSSSTAYQTAMTYARNNNCLVFAAAGNSNSTTVQYPGNYTGVVSVAALDRGNVKADFSNYGSWIDLSAPGVDIWSTMVVNTYNPNAYEAWAGTSMATPTAASVAALALSRNPGLTDDELETQILSTATSVNPQNPSYPNQLGAGIVNASALINAISPGGITVSSPNGGESYLIGSTAAIQWSANPSITNVRIELNRSYPSAIWETIIASTANSGSYNWSVAGTPTATARIRISNASNASVADTSNANFTIYGVRVLSPNGGESWNVGETRSITWTAATSYANVKIELYRSSSATWETIVASTSNNGSYNWLISGSVSTTARIRISNAVDATIADSSDANFSIFVLATTLQEYFEGTFPPTQWSNSGDWAQYLYSGNRSARLNYYDINDIGARDSMFTPPLNLSGFGTATLRFSTSYALYSGYYDSLVVVARVGSGAWSSLWRQGGSALSNRTGREPSAFRSNSIALSSQYLVNGIQFAFIGYNGYGDNLYLDSVAISGSSATTITVISPNGGESWAIGSVHPITWSSQNLTGNVHIVIDRNYPSGNWNSLFTNTANDGTENWTVSGSATSSARIRILSVNNLTIGDSSNANFALILPTITLTRPNGGENLYTGKTDTIRWTSTNLTGTVSLFLNRSYPSGSWDSLTTIAYNATPYLWTPSGSATNTARLRISSNTFPAVADTSNANITITASQNLLTYPNGGQSFLAGTVDTIRWNTNLPGNVAVMWTRNYPAGSWYSIGTSPASNGQFGWTIPDSSTTTARIAVIPEYLPALADTSNANVTIIHPTVQISHPNGGETLYIGRSDTIRWTANFTGSVAIAYSPVGADIFNAEILSGEDSVPLSQGWFVWTPHLPLTTQGIICLIEWTNGTEYWSDSNFTTVAPQLTIQHPNGGETLYPGLSDTIRWTTNLTGAATIAYCSAGADIFQAEILAGGDSIPLSQGWFAWTPHLPLTTHGRVCIVEWSNGEEHWSNSDFSVASPQMSMLYPNGGESFLAGTVDTLRWMTNIPGNVVVKWTRNYPSSLWHSIDTVEASNGELVWTFPDSATTTARFAIVPQNLPSASDTSNANITIIHPTVQFIHPNGGETLYIGQSDTIRWTANFTGSVAIAYSPVGADIFNAEILSGEDSIPLSQGWYAWTPHSPETTQGRVCLIEWSNGNEHWSNGDFTVSSRQLTLQRPNGGEVFVHGTTDTIRWNAQGLTGTVQIQINRSYPSGIWDSIATVDVGASPYLWTVSGALTSSARIRILATLIPTMGDTSSSAFQIITNEPPAIPAQLVITSDGNSMRLSWQPVDTTSSGLVITVTGYRIYAGTTLTNLSLAGTTAHRDSTAWIDTGVLLSTEFKLYRVTAIIEGTVDSQSAASDVTILENNSLVKPESDNQNRFKR